jgi:hypothetical protein
VSFPAQREKELARLRAKLADEGIEALAYATYPSDGYTYALVTNAVRDHDKDRPGAPIVSVRCVPFTGICGMLVDHSRNFTFPYRRRVPAPLDSIEMVSSGSSAAEEGCSKWFFQRNSRSLVIVPRASCCVPHGVRNAVRVTTFSSRRWSLSPCCP